MGLKNYQSKVLYVQPKTRGDVSFQEKNFGFPVSQVSQEEFLEKVFGDYQGHLCVFQKKSNGTTSNTFYKKSEKERMNGFLKKTFGIDTYVSYSTYFRKRKKSKTDKLRTQSNIVQTYMLVQDLDYYKDKMTDAEVLRKLGDMVRNNEIICPSFLVSTGRGYQLIWLVEPFKNIAGYTYDKDWTTIQNHLYEKLKAFKSDTVVKNPSAVTRLVGTKHRSSGNKVFGFLSNEQIFTLKDFMFFHDIVPAADRKVRAKKVSHVNSNQSVSVTRMVSNWNEFTLNRYREMDIFTFVRVQNERGISYVGLRNWLGLVLRFHSLVSSQGDKEYAKEQVISLCSEMNMEETSEQEILRRSGLAENYYDDWVNDTWNRDKYVQGGLFYTNRRMLELMDIKDDYYIQWKMKTIKIKDKKYDSARKRFEKFGGEADEHTWKAYQKRRNEKLLEEKEDKLWLLQKAMEKHPNATQRELSKVLGFNQSTISRLMKKM